MSDHPPSLIRVFAVRMKKAWVLSYPLSAQRRLWSDWANAQVDLSLHWAHSHFVGCVMLRLIYLLIEWRHLWSSLPWIVYFPILIKFTELPHGFGWGNIENFIPVNRNTEINIKIINEPPHDKTNKVACAPSEDSDQPWHSPSLIRVFAVRMKKALVFSYPLSTQRRLRSDWADAQADLSLRWAHVSVCWFCRVVAQIVLLNDLLEGVISVIFTILLMKRLNNTESGILLYSVISLPPKKVIFRTYTG